LSKYTTIKPIDRDDVIPMYDNPLLIEKLNEVINYINERRDIPKRALAVEGLAARQAQTIVRWWLDNGFTKEDIKSLLDL